MRCKDEIILCNVRKARSLRQPMSGFPQSTIDFSCTFPAHHDMSQSTIMLPSPLDLPSSSLSCLIKYFTCQSLCKLSSPLSSSPVHHQSLQSSMNSPSLQPTFLNNNWPFQVTIDLSSFPLTFSIHHQPLSSFSTSSGHHQGIQFISVIHSLPSFRRWIFHIFNNMCLLSFSYVYFSWSSTCSD